MPKFVLPAPLAGLSRRVVAIIAGALIVVSGGIATFAATGAEEPTLDASADSSFAATATSAAPEPTPTPAPETPTPTPTPTPSPAAVTVTDSGVAGGAGGNNIVMINNHQDDRLRVRGSVQINRITAPNVAPQNLARAYSSCTDCETLAVAMQINLIRRDTHRVVPGNAAVAINYQCTRCRTVAFSLQYTLSVDDPRQTPRDVRDLVRAMDAELRAIAANPTDLADAINRINAVINRFVALAESLREERDEATATTTPGAAPEGEEPSPTVTPSPEPTPTASDSVSPEASVTATPAPSPTPEEPTPVPSGAP